MSDSLQSYGQKPTRLLCPQDSLGKNTGVGCHFLLQLNIGTPQNKRQMLTVIKREMNSNTITVQDFNTPLSPIDRLSRQKINKETEDLNDTLHQMDLIDIYRMFYLKAAEYTFFSCAHGIFSRIDHMLVHKMSLSKFKKIEIISSIFSDQNTIKLEINHKGKKCKNTNSWGQSNMLLNNQLITEEIKKKIKNYLETNENESTMV